MVVIILVSISIEIVTHLGINPVSGGSPLKDISIMGINNWINGDIECSFLTWLLFKREILLNIRKIGVIIKE